MVARNRTRRPRARIEKVPEGDVRLLLATVGEITCNHTSVDLETALNDLTEARC
jgi:hypothetical protein